jgi:hypothetical protein
MKSVSTGFWKRGEAGSDGKKSAWRSTTFFNITKVKVLAAFSLVADMLLQGGKIPLVLKPSPWSDITLDEMEDEARAEIEEIMEDAQKNIHQQFQDCRADKKMLQNIMSGAMYGETYAKRTVIEVERQYYKRTPMAPQGYGMEQASPSMSPNDRFMLVEDRFPSPAWEYVSNWDIYRDVETDDLQAGAGVIHRDHWSTFDLRSSAGKPLFIKQAIKDVLGQATKSEDQTDKQNDLKPGARDIQHRTRNIRVLEFWGRAPRKAVEEFERNMQSGGRGNRPQGSDGRQDTESAGDEIEIMAMVAGDQVIRFARTKHGTRPIYRTVWEDVLDDVCGCGIADNLEDVQLVLNGAIRGFEDNARLSGDVILAGHARNFHGTPDICPGKWIDLSDEVEDVREGLQQFKIEFVGQGYLEIIGMFDRFADVVSMIPQITQGVRPDKGSDTAYELSQLLENAGKYLGGVIRNYDDGLIEPIGTDFYRYNMMDPDAPGKGDFVVVAQGFSSFQARLLRVQKLMRLLALTLQYPLLQGEIKFGEHLKELYKAEDMDPDVFLKSREEKQADAERAMQAAQEQQKAALEAEQAKMQMEEQARAQQHERDMDRDATKQAGQLLSKVLGRGGEKANSQGVAP